VAFKKSGGQPARLLNSFSFLEEHGKAALSAAAATLMIRVMMGTARSLILMHIDSLYIPPPLLPLGCQVDSDLQLLQYFAVNCARPIIGLLLPDRA